MTDSAANADEGKRHSAFTRGDVITFVVFPIVLILGFLLFQWRPKTSADPNLRLVAQVTDDISVELVAVAWQNQANAGATMWWKPNGLPASDIKQNPKSTTFGSSDPGFYFLYRCKNKRAGKNSQVTGPATGSGSWLSEIRDGGSGNDTIVITNAKPDFWNSVDAGVRISTEGQQYVGELTQGNAKLSTLVGGRAATIEVLSGKALTDVTKYQASPCVLEITEPIMSEWSGNSYFSVEVFDEAGIEAPRVSNQVGQQGNNYRHVYFFNCVAWSRIVIHRRVDDAKVMFESVSAQLNSITTPRIGEISKARSK